MKPEDVFSSRRQFLAFCSLAGLAVSLPTAAISAPTASLSFDAPQLRTLSAIVDTIIPKTDTAGAAEAGVPEFIILIASEWMDTGQREAFMSGLADFTRLASVSLGGEFAAMTSDAREAYLQSELVAAQAAQTRQKNSGHAPFLVWMKRLTVHGYYTSQAGASEELVLNAMPGEYVACHKMAGGEHGFSMDRRHIPFIVDNEVVRIK